jgi:Cof subfamily protein (haloacid dehalogenase superfamily)
MVLFVSDLDGTLLNNSSSIDPNSIEKLNTLLGAGVHFTVATARAYPSIKTILDGLNLTLPIIEQNGALIRDYTSGHVLSAQLMARQSVADVCHAFARWGAFPTVSVLLGDENVVLHGEINNPGMEWAIESMGQANQPRRLIEYRDMSTIMSAPVLIFRYLGSEKEIKNIGAEIIIRHPDLSVTMFHNFYTDGWEINVSSLNANKGHALRELREHAKGIRKVVVFGDSDNDMDMFHHADESYAVANGTPEARLKATATIGLNTEEAVVQFIENHARSVSLAGTI